MRLGNRFLAKLEFLGGFGGFAGRESVAEDKERKRGLQK